MVLGIVPSYGEVIPQFIFPYGLRLNAVADFKCLEKVVQPWTEKVAVVRPYFWQQDSV